MNDEEPYLISYWNPKTVKAVSVCVRQKHACSLAPRRSARFISEEHHLPRRLEGTSMCRVRSGRKVRRLCLSLSGPETRPFSPVATWVRAVTAISWPRNSVTRLWWLQLVILRDSQMWDKRAQRGCRGHRPQSTSSHVQIRALLPPGQRGRAT